MTPNSERVAAAFKWACLAELEAPKPGNVHVFAGGHGMTADTFVRSAEAAAAPLSLAGARVGARILGAVDATRAAVGTNSNLGIILLCAPLAAAAGRARPDLRGALHEVLDDLDVQDASLAFAAIAKAAPAGLGRSARHDVREAATVGLLQAMAEGAERDRIARQYTTCFADVFELGLPALDTALARQAELNWATVMVYLSFLAAFPDSHIVRKFGADNAGEVRRIASAILASAQEKRPAQRLAELLAWDAALKAKGINPGTSADLTVATLFVHRLRTILPSARNND